MQIQREFPAASIAIISDGFVGENIFWGYWKVAVISELLCEKRSGENFLKAHGIVAKLIFSKEGCANQTFFFFWR